MPKARILSIVLVAMLVSLLGALVHSKPDEPAKKTAVAPFGIDQRVPWTTSRVAGSPEPPDPLTTSRLFPNLKLDRPLDIQIAPDGKRWFISEQMGKIYSIPTSGDVRNADQFLDIRAGLRDSTRQMWSMTFHPKYAENGYVYVCFIEYKPQPTRCRIERFTVPKDARAPGAVPTADPASEYIIAE
jgi:hypothetical protein